MPIKNLSKKISLVAVIGLLLFLHFIGALRPIESAVTWTLKPIARMVYGTSLQGYSWYNSLNQCSQLATENQNLRSALTHKQLSAIDYQELIEENKYLRQELDFVSATEEKMLVTQIIAKPLLQNDLIVIDRGSASGLHPGLPVLANQGILVGKIHSVEPQKAYVTLLTNNNSSVAVSLNNSQHTQGVVQGNLGLGLLMDLVPPGEEINSGDVVYSSGLEENIRGRYIVGELGMILTETGDIYQQAEVIPAVNYNNLKYLTVVISQ